MRGLAYRRSEREKHINRKEGILRRIRGYNPPHSINDKDSVYTFEGCSFYFIPSRGYLNKGKIHCSCPGCSPKSKTEGYTHRDECNLLKMKDLEKIYFN